MIGHGQAYHFFVSHYSRMDKAVKSWLYKVPVQIYKGLSGNSFIQEWAWGTRIFNINTPINRELEFTAVRFEKIVILLITFKKKPRVLGNAPLASFFCFIKNIH